MWETGFSAKPAASDRGNAHVIVCGNEKGGSGKSTTAMHIAVALLKQDHRVATVDLDGRQLSLTRYVDNRRRWSARGSLDLAVPQHFHVPPARRDSVSDAESEEFAHLSRIIAEIQTAHDFVVIDTPGADSFLNRLAHRIADTLITPINDSFIDFDVLARVDPLSHEIVEVSQYAAAVREARRERRRTDGTVLDWVVLRNRMSSITSRNEQKIDRCLRDLSMQLGFRIADGISERVIFREFFPIGLTALDDFEEHVLGSKPTLSHLAARQEIRQLLSALRLPTDERGHRRADARRRYAETVSRPLAMPDIFAG
ncbi:division plane positioning ATPase MipZ [Aquibium sp. A9E412]|uniref:division plane positioning ATPase MipZ n=1 Tax=Aquibium sp. A9E412 TaxID=2976767 RepID=UPI0025B04DA7|nr:division plane positioning ATPase MipZ [Aquibium sp. A9E412]MDN2564725.1 division plane positioning ATPase MipZ [Aquibium sp. A9E412]